MAQLGLLRHAKSDYPTGVGDHERPLSRRGERDARSRGGVIRSRMEEPDLVIVSTARRAQQTWELASSAWSDIRPRHDEPRIYEASVDTLFEVLHEVDGNVRSLLLVGHNPGFEYLALALAGEGSRAEPLARLHSKYPTCALACFEVAGAWADLTPGRGVLQSFDTSR